jgi:hypothetical protein
MTPAGTATWLVFDGTNDYVKLADDGLLFGSSPSTTNFTIELWIKGKVSPASTGGTGFAVHLAKDANLSTCVYLLGINGVTSNYCAGVDGQYAAGDTGIAADQSTWHLLAVTYDGNAQKVYLDGEIKAS